MRRLIKEEETNFRVLINAAHRILVSERNILQNIRSQYIQPTMMGPPEMVIADCGKCGRGNAALQCTGCKRCFHPDCVSGRRTSSGMRIQCDDCLAYPVVAAPVAAPRSVAGSVVSTVTALERERIRIAKDKISIRRRLLVDQQEVLTSTRQEDHIQVGSESGVRQNAADEGGQGDQSGDKTNPGQPLLQTPTFRTGGVVKQSLLMAPSNAGPSSMVIPSIQVHPPGNTAARAELMLQLEELELEDQEIDQENDPRSWQLPNA